LFYVGANVDPMRDMQFIRGPIDVLDHASDITGIGSKVGIDATRKWESEGFKRKWPKDLKMEEEVINLVSEKWRKYGIPEQYIGGVEIIRAEKILTELEANSGGGKIGQIESGTAENEF